MGHFSVIQHGAGVVRTALYQIVIIMWLLTILLISQSSVSFGEELGFHKTCPAGYELQLDRKSNQYECTCKKYHLYWPPDGLCYREFQQGPCPDGHR